MNTIKEFVGELRTATSGSPSPLKSAMVRLDGVSAPGPKKFPDPTGVSRRAKKDIGVGVAALNSI
jgi:hypothetical protein